MAWWRRATSRSTSGSPAATPAPVPITHSPITGPDADRFPSLGFSGGRIVDLLNLTLPDAAVHGGVSRVTFAFPAGSPSKVDLLGFRMMREGRTYDIADNCVDPTFARDPITLGPMRSERVDGARVSVDLSPAVVAESVLIVNRIDGYGVRARRGQVSVTTEDGTTHLLWTAERDDLPALRDLLSRLGIDPNSRNSDLLRDVVTYLDATPFNLNANELRLLFALLPSGTPAEGPTLNATQYRLLAHGLCAQRQLVPLTPTSLRTWQFVLRNRGSLDELQATIDDVAPKYSIGPQSVARHGLRDCGGLRRDAAHHRSAMARTSEEFADLGYTLMLAYGTLLGAVRDGDFLPHDDDVDMIFALAATDLDTAKTRIAELLTEFERRGWGVWTNPSENCLNFHLTPPGSPTHVDVFPLLVGMGAVAATSTLHMDAMKFREIPTDVMLPPQPLEFLGHTFAGPAHPAAFLEARYGSGWTITDPWYDWPWKLESSSGSFTVEEPTS